jgi:predicted ArsR family transcriptional regulator
MLTSQRKRLILEQLAREGQVLSKALSTQFAVSEDTIRRDLRELAAEGNYSASTAERYLHRERQPLSLSVSLCVWIRKSGWRKGG